MSLPCQKPASFPLRLHPILERSYKSGALYKRRANLNLLRSSAAGAAGVAATAPRQSPRTDGAFSASGERPRRWLRLAALPHTNPPPPPLPGGTPAPPPPPERRLPALPRPGAVGGRPRAPGAGAVPRGRGRRPGSKESPRRPAKRGERGGAAELRAARAAAHRVAAFPAAGAG